MKKIYNIYVIAILLITLVGCNQKETTTNESASLEPIAHTLYSEKTELFVEFKPLIVGETSKFAAHFTILGENFKALTEGTVTVSLLVNDKGIRNTATQPSSPGIFRLVLKPTTAGKGTLVFDIKTKDYTDKITIPNVTVYPNVETAQKFHSEHGHSDDISYLKEQAWKIDFATKEVQPETFHNVISASGQIISAPGDEAIITAKATGIVRFINSNAIVGNEIKQGNSLFKIESNGLTENNIDATVNEAKATYLKAKADYERSKALVEDQIISAKEHQNNKLIFENAKTNYSKVSANYTGNGIVIPTPMTGYLKEIMVTDGQFVESGTPLATISKNKRLLIQANISQNNFASLSQIKSANFKTAQSETIFETDKLNGKVVSYGKSASANMPFIPITFEIDNIGNLISGSAIEVFLKSTPIENVLIVPVTSLLEEQGHFYVYVQTAGESFQKREVTLGASDGANVEIKSGITKGERVVTKGAYQIKLATASGAMPAHGHEH